VSGLYRCRLSVVLTHSNILTYCRPGTHSAWSIIAWATIRIVPADKRMIVVCVSDNSPVDIHNSRIILEVVVSPPAAIKARTAISVTIVYAAVISDIPSPITMMKAIIATTVTPIARSPEIPVFRWLHPLTRYPVKIISVIGPISGCPKVTIIRA